MKLIRGPGEVNVKTHLEYGNVDKLKQPLGTLTGSTLKRHNTLGFDSNILTH